MRLCLVFLSSIFALLLGDIYAQENLLTQDSELRERYSFQIETEKASISGIMILHVTDEEIIGSMINEFGVSAIDFIYNRKKDKVKLVNVVCFLNKWYIKLVLKNDIKLCIHVLFDIPYKENKNYLIEASDDTVSIFNKKRKLRYSFSPLTSPELQYDTEE